MKELDVLLEDFLARHEQELMAGGWPELETLLYSEDDLVWDWLQQPAREQAAPA
jgi:succinate dehydrogenase flavin-adding protein (antitoxin of CptAB toxin-antitoxin module)